MGLITEDWKTVLFVLALLGSFSALVRTASEQAPQFTTDFPMLYDFSNSTGGKLACTTNLESGSSTTWLLSDGSAVTSVPRLRHVIPDGSLVFPPFGAEDYRQDVHGVSYRCAATNALGTLVSNEIKVRGVVAQAFDIHVYDVYTIRGNSAVMRCHIPKFLQSYVNVTAWIKDSVISITNSNLDSNSKYILLPSGELVITDVDSNDGYTNYQCQVTHRLTGQIKTSLNPGRLIVTDSDGKVPPKITFSLPEVIAVEDNNVFLPCIGNGLPLPKYSWQKQTATGKSHTIEKNGRFKVLAGSLSIHNVRQSDTGVYTCTVTNDVNYDRRVTEVTILDSVKATIDPSSAIVNADAAITLTCKISGSTAFSIIWTKDGKTLPFEGVTQTNNDTIHIPKMQLHLAGIYQCFVQNDAYSTFGVATIKLGDSLPVILKGFEEQVKDSGDYIKLQCSGIGNPMPEFYWTLDNLAISGNSRIKIANVMTDGHEIYTSLEVYNVKPEDGGIYRCIAKSRAGQTAFASRINVKGRLGVRQNVKIHAVEKGDIRIDCPVYGYPIVEIKWERNRYSLPFDLRQTVLSNNSLIIRNVLRRSDSGKYTCKVKGNENQRLRGDVELIVMVPPKITPFSFQDDLIREGARAQLQCVVSEGESPLKINWLKNGQMLVQEQGITQRNLDEFSSIVMISSISPRHNGNYTCVAQNAAGVTQHTASLFVNVPPRWTTQFQDHILQTGSDLFLNCAAEGFPTPEISWRKITDSGIDDESIIEDVTDDEHTRVYSNGTLAFRDVQRVYEGQYLCVASNGVEMPISHIVSIKIKASPEFEESEKIVIAQKGQNVNMTCEATGDWPIHYRWSVNKEIIADNKGSQRYNIEDTQDETNKRSVSILQISWVDRKDSTTFTCHATNDIGESQLNFIVSVQEYPDAPVIETPVKVINQSVELSWSVPYNGNTNILHYILQYKKTVDRWTERVNNLSVPGTRNSAKIPNLNPATMYSFHVLAENSVGNSSFSEEVSAKTDETEPHGAPENVDVESLDANTLRVTWKPPKKNLWNGAIRGYNIGYKIFGGTMEYTFAKLEVPEDYTEELIYQLVDLNMYTQYIIIVQAYNSKGNGPISEEVLAMTSEDVPSSPPENVRCSALSSKSIYVLWDSPALDTVNGILRGFKVIFKSVDIWPDAMVQTQTVTSTKLTINELSVNTNYSIQVAAFTKMGDGVKSSTIFCKTHEDVPEPPETIKVLPSSSDAVVVAWKPPRRANGILIKYNIYYKSIENGQLDINSQKTEELLQNANVHQSSGNTQHIELKGLRKNKKYAFWVTATSAIGESSGSTVVAQTVADSIVAAKTASFDTVINTPWKEDIMMPCTAVGIPTPNRRWTFGNQLLKEDTRLKIGQDGSVIINKISPEDSGNYTCAVYNEYGRDEVSYLVAVQVPPSAPVMDVVSKTRASIKLQWKPGHTAKDNIRGYLLHYKQDNGVWNNVEIRSDQSLFTLDKLSCGSTYQIYMEAFNNIGTGAPCDTITVTTEGTDVVPPSKENIIREGSSFITVHLDAWPSSGCPVKNFAVEYKALNGKEWVSAGTNLRPSQKKLIISGLVPSTWYMLRLSAESSNTPTMAEYRFATHTVSGGTIQPDTLGESISPVYIFYLDPLIFIPAVALLIVVIIASVVVCIYFKRRNGHVETPSDNYDTTSQMNAWIRNSQTLPKDFFNQPGFQATLSRHSAKEPSPYATSHLTDHYHPEHGKFRPGPMGFSMMEHESYPTAAPGFNPYLAAQLNETTFTFPAQADDYDPPPMAHMIRNSIPEINQQN